MEMEMSMQVRAVLQVRPVAGQTGQAVKSGAARNAAPWRCRLAKQAAQLRCLAPEYCPATGAAQARPAHRGTSSRCAGCLDWLGLKSVKPGHECLGAARAATAVELG